MLIVSFLRRIYLNRVNSRIIKNAKSVGLRFRNNSTISCVNRNTIIGDDVSFNGMRIIGDGSVSIGSHFHCAEGCYIITENHDYDHGRELPYDRELSLPKAVIIEDNVWLGACVIILPGVHIGEGVIIQAGSVVCGDIPPCSIAGGHPAVVFKERDKEHYYKLKKNKAYIVNNV